MNTNLENPKKPQKYVCEYCNFNTCNKKDYVRHLSTDKHLGLINPNEKPIKTLFNCICGKSYKHSSSLCNHKKICNHNNANENNVNKETPCEKIEIYDLVKYLMKENTELKNMMIEQNNKITEQQNLVLEIAKNGTHNTTTHTNSHNKAFNLNFFLNETCKDAMNIMDFVESIKLQVSDLEAVGELGYVEGISNIIVKNLKDLDVTQRPVHCTDKKRETMYVKDADKWEKDEHTTILSKVIKKVASKNARLLPKFKEKYPDYGNYHSKNSDKYSKIIVESMGGSGNNDLEKEEKIIRNIAKNVVVDKELL